MFGVRNSKFRHVVGKEYKKELCFLDTLMAKSGQINNFVACNAKYTGLIWESLGGGNVAIFNNEKPGKIPSGYPLLNGHTNPVLDLEFNPFNDDILATCSEDSLIKIWKIPEGGLTEKVSPDGAEQVLKGHKRKVGTVNWHPTANNVIASSGLDYVIKVWDVEKGEEVMNLDPEVTQAVMCLNWNYDGSLLGTISRDKYLRIWDPRANKVTQKTIAHEGPKGGRVVWCGPNNRLITTGFTRQSEREFKIWDSTDLSKPLSVTSIDVASGLLKPHFDADTGMLYLAGKGDGSIKYYEIEDTKSYFISEYRTAVAQKDICVMPKKDLNVKKCEIARIIKLTGKEILPVSFTVPRKSDLFQEDLFPNAYAGQPALFGAEWFEGKGKDPVLISLEPDVEAVAIVGEEKETVEVIVAEKEKTPEQVKTELDAANVIIGDQARELAEKAAKIDELEKLVNDLQEKLKVAENVPDVSDAGDEPAEDLVVEGVTTKVQTDQEVEEAAKEAPDSPLVVDDEKKTE